MIEKKRALVAAGIIFVSIVAESFFIIGALYSAKKIRSLNLFLGGIRAAFQKPKKEAELAESPELNADSISGLFPSVSESKEEIALDEFSRSFSEGGLSFEISESGKTIAVSGGFAGKNSQKSASESSWTYEHPSKILSKPALFADSVVFTDAQLRVVQVKAENGMLVNTFPSNVLPAGAAKAQGASYFFAGKNGKRYAAAFGREIPSQKKEKPISASAIFIPSLSAQSKILSRIEVWQTFDSEGADVKNSGSVLSPIFDDVSVFPISGSSPLEKIDHAPKIFAFCPENSADFSFEIQFFDKKRAEIPSYAAVFTREGELAASSLDESPANPVVKAALDKNRVYYVAFGALAAVEKEKPLFAAVSEEAENDLRN